jgi:hypothetical protein
MNARREITVQALEHPRGWIMLRFRLEMQPGAYLRTTLMLNTGRPQSVIGARTAAFLASMDIAERLDRRRFRIRAPRTEEGDPLPDITARLSAGPPLLGVDGMLGWDYFRQFAEVRIAPDTLRFVFVLR